MKLILFYILLSAYAISSNAFAEDVKVEGAAAEEYHLIGGWGWKVQVDNVIIGPSELAGTILSVGQTSARNPLKGIIDPAINAGDRVIVYGNFNDKNFINLMGSNEFYLKKSQGAEGTSSSKMLPSDEHYVFVGSHYSNSLFGFWHPLGWTRTSSDNTCPGFVSCNSNWGGTVSVCAIPASLTGNPPTSHALKSYLTNLTNYEDSSVSCGQRILDCDNIQSPIDITAGNEDWERAQFYSSRSCINPANAKRAFIAWIEDDYFIIVNAQIHENLCEEEDISCPYIDVDDVLLMVDHTFWWHTETYPPQEWVDSGRY